MTETQYVFTFVDINMKSVETDLFKTHAEAVGHAATIARQWYDEEGVEVPEWCQSDDDVLEAFDTEDAFDGLFIIQVTPV